MVDDCILQFVKMEAVLRFRPQFPGPLETVNDQGAKDEAGLSQLAHFHQFKDLPAEFRQMIYRSCIPRRTFKLLYHRWWSLSTVRYLGKKPAALPLIAFVSKEAYHVSKLHLQEFEVILRDHPDLSSPFQWRDETTGIRFDLNLDTLFICDRIHRQAWKDDEDRHNGAFALTMKPKVNLVLDMYGLAPVCVPLYFWTFRMSYPYYDILAQKSHCTVVLAKTSFFAKESEIRTSGLFGLFGEERTVFVDIHDILKIDQFETDIRHLDPMDYRCNEIQENDSFFRQQEDLLSLGPGRYGSYGAAFFDQARTHGRDYDPIPPLVHSVAGLHSVVEQDAASARYLIQQSVRFHLKPCADTSLL